MSISKLRIKRSELSAFLGGVVVFCLCFNNRVISGYIPMLSGLQAYGKIILMAVFFLLLFLYRIKWSKTMIYTTIFCVWGIISTLYNAKSIVAMISSFSSFFLIVLVLEYYKSRKNKLNVLLQTWKVLLLGVVLIDIYTELKYRNGMYTTDLYMNNWFLGYKTERVIYSLPLVMIATYTSLENDKELNISLIIYVVLAMINSIFSDATAASVMFAVILILIVIYKLVYSGKKKFIDKILDVVLNYRFIIILYIVLTIMVVISQNAYFLSIVSSAFDKSITFSGRNRIWTTCLSAILNNPLVGCGYLSGAEYVSLVGMNAATNAHNMVLQILMLGGFIALIIYVFLVVSVIKGEMEKTKKDISYIGVFAIFIYATFLLGITSATFVFSSFGMLPYWLFENYKIMEHSIDQVQKKN